MQVLTSGKVLARLRRLRQSEIAGNEKHHHHNTNDVKNIVHVSFSFLSGDRVYRLSHDEAQWNLKFSDITRIGILHLWGYVAAVYAVKVRNHMFLATRASHNSIPFLFLYWLFTILCVRTSSTRAFGHCVTGRHFAVACLFDTSLENR